MFKQGIHRSLLWLVSIVAILAIGIAGCSDSESGAENDEWVGTWILQTTNGQSVEQVFADYGEVSVVTNTWKFNSDGTMEGEIAVKIDAKKGFTQVLENGAIKFAGTYALSGSNYVFKPTEMEATGFMQISESWKWTEEEKRVTGKWIRSGDTLVLATGYDTSVFEIRVKPNSQLNHFVFP